MYSQLKLANQVLSVTALLPPFRQYSLKWQKHQSQRVGLKLWRRTQKRKKSIILHRSIRNMGGVSLLHVSWYKRAFCSTVPEEMTDSAVPRTGTCTGGSTLHRNGSKWPCPGLERGWAATYSHHWEVVNSTLQYCFLNTSYHYYTIKKHAGVQTNTPQLHALFQKESSNAATQSLP